MTRESSIFTDMQCAFSGTGFSTGAEGVTNFLQMAESLGEVFLLQEIEDGELRVLYLSPGCDQIWGRSADYFCSHSEAWFGSIHLEDRERIRGITLGSGFMQEAFEEEFRIIHANGSIRWVRERARPVTNADSGTIRMAGIVEDVTDRKQLEKHLLELDDRERFRIGQDLHDGICQQLVSIAFATDLLHRSLESKTPDEAYRVAKIMALLDGAIFQARSLSQVLYPVNLSGSGLSVALRGLGETVLQVPGVSFIAECADTVNVKNGSLAMHIYRIAQESVQNALQHSCPNQLILRFTGDENFLHLEIIENGLLSDEQGEADYENSLNAIRFRAQLAGGNVKVKHQTPGGKTLEFSFENLTAPVKNAPPKLLQTEVAL